jgi:hypothetical protein
MAIVTIFDGRFGDDAVLAQCEKQFKFLIQIFY